MTTRWLRALVLSAPLVAACGVIPDLVLGAEAGIPPIVGSTAIAIPQDFKCGDPIVDPNDTYKVTSSGDAQACTFSFKQDVVALTADKYDDDPRLEGARVLNGVQIDVKKFAVRDETGKEPKGLLSLDGKAFGVTILTEEDLDAEPPYSKSVSGAPIDKLKSQVQAKQDIIIPVDVEVVVSLDPAPTRIELDFEAQPNLSIGF